MWAPQRRRQPARSALLTPVGRLPPRPERYPRLHRLPKTRMPGGGPPDLDGVEPLRELNEVHEAKIDVEGKSGEAASVSRG